MLRPVRSLRSVECRLILPVLLLSCLALIPGRGMGAEGVEDTGFSRAGLRVARLAVAPVLERVEADSWQAQGRPGLQAFYARHSTRWEIQWDLRSDRPHLVQGVGIPLLPGVGNQLTAEAFGLDHDVALDLQTVEGRVRDLMADMGDLLGIEPQQLRLDPRRSADVGDSLWLLAFQQVHNAVPVEGAHVFWRINHGNVVQFGTQKVAAVTVSTSPGLRREQAFEHAMISLGIPCEGCELLEPGRLLILPVAADDDWASAAYEGPPGAGYAHLLTWDIVYRPQPRGPAYRLRVEANTGEVLEHRALIRWGEVQGSVHSAPGVVEVVPFPHTTVENMGLKVTDETGAYLYEGGQAQTQLDGELIEIQDACGPLLLTSNDGLLDLGGGGTDCTTSGLGGAGNTQAARDAFFHLSGAYDRAFTYQPLLGFTLGWPLTARTNLTITPCSAYWNSAEGSVNFSRSGNGCTNSGEVSGVLLHELGHAVDEALGGVAVDGASGEATADVFALLETRDACIGRGLRPGEICHNCTRDCTGVRDLAAFALGGDSTLAHPKTIEDNAGIDCDRFACPYQGNATYQGPMGYQAHCESYIASTAVYDLASSLQCPWGEAAAWQTMRELWFQSMPALGSAYRLGGSENSSPCAPQLPVDGCAADNWYTVFLAVDDDDGNLLNGTPHACQIYDAFAAHGPDCSCAQLLDDETTCAWQWPLTQHFFTFTLQNLFSEQVTEIRLTPIDPPTPLIDFDPSIVTVFPPLEPPPVAGTTTQTAEVNGPEATGGQQVRFFISTHNEDGICCSIEHEITLDSCRRHWPVSYPYPPSDTKIKILGGSDFTLVKGFSPHGDTGVTLDAGSADGMLVHWSGLRSIDAGGGLRLSANGQVDGQSQRLGAIDLSEVGGRIAISADSDLGPVQRVTLYAEGRAVATLESQHLLATGWPAGAAFDRASGGLSLNWAEAVEIVGEGADGLHADQLVFAVAASRQPEALTSVDLTAAGIEELQLEAAAYPTER